MAGVTPTEALKAVVEIGEFTGDRLAAWKTDMGKEKYERITANYRDKPGYIQEETYNKQPWEVERPDGTKIQRKAMWERWDDGSRSTWVDSDGQVRVELEEGRGFRIATTSTEKAMYQETVRSLPYGARLVVENLSVKIGDDGKKVVERSLHESEDQWLDGPRDRYTE